MPNVKSEKISNIPYSVVKCTVLAKSYGTLTLDGSIRLVVAYGPCEEVLFPITLAWLTSAYSEAVTRPCNLFTKILAALVFLALFSNMAAIGSSSPESWFRLLLFRLALEFAEPGFQLGSNHK